MQYLTEYRKQIYNLITENQTVIKFIDGIHKGEQGLVLKKSKLKDNSYTYKRIDFKYNNYFDLVIRLNNNDIIRTSCDNVSL